MQTKSRLVILLGLSMSLTSAWASHGKKSADEQNKVVDSGTFGIFLGGHRVATETFSIQQKHELSVTTSEVKTDEGGQEISQTSELQLASNGDLVNYLWRENKPEKLESNLQPGDQIITQHLTLNEKDKAPKDIPYILPSSTSVLDDYFFVHREILAWKYLASECPDLKACKLNKASIGVIIPRQHTSGMVTMEFKGRDKVSLHGSEQELNHFLLQADDVEWSLYLNDQQKLMKVEVASAQTEAIRD